MSNIHMKKQGLGFAIASCLAMQFSASAFAQTETPAPSEAESTKLEKVTVTGSRIKRSEIEGPSPVVVITSEQMEKEGFVSVYDVLETVTQNVANVQNELNSAGGFTPNGSPINLRGLGVGRTLLLINGRRAADYPFPYNGQSNFQSFGNIPSAAVDRIEILSGGASAIYGSDAVAGVVNVVLKTDFDGDVFKTRVGSSWDGGGEFGDIQWVGGKTGDNWSVTYALEYFKDEPMYGFEREFMDSIYDNPLPPVVGNQPVTTLRISRRGTTNTPNIYFAPPAGACEAFGGEFNRQTYRTLYTSTHALAGQAYNLGDSCGYPGFSALQTISNGNHDLSGYAYGTYNFANDMEARVSLMAYDSKSKLDGGPENITTPHVNGVGRSTTGVFITNPGINQNVDMQRLLTPAEYGGFDASAQRFHEKSLDVSFGLRGVISDRFDWDVSIGRADYKADRTRPRLNGSKVTEWFWGNNIGTATAPRYLLNMDRWYTPLTPDQYRAMSDVLLYQAHSWVNQASAVLSGDLFDMPAGPVAFAAVLETSTQGYDLKSPQGILPQNRTTYNLTGTNGGGERDRHALGAEFSVPLLESLKWTLAARYDKYDDITAVDDAKTWASGLEWRPLDNLLVRGNYSTSFKAPDMHFVFNEGSGSFATQTDAFRCLSTGGRVTAGPLGPATCAGSTYAYSVFSTSKGEPTLREEEGESWTAGFIWDFAENMSFGMDYYNIELQGAVAQLSGTFILDNEAGCRTGLNRNGTPYISPGAAFCQEVISRVTRVAATGELTDRVFELRTGPVNQSYLRVSGVDASFKYRQDTDNMGNFNLGLDWSHTLNSERQTFATDPIQTEWRDHPTNFSFRSRIRGSVGWQKDTWSSNVFVSRYGSLPNWAETGRIAPYFLTNVNVSKSFTENLRVGLYVNNLFNKFHPKDDTYNSYPYFWRAYSPVGRELSVQVEYKL